MREVVKGKMEQDQINISLIDCYRVALDFGLPVAEKAINNLHVTLPAQQQINEKTSTIKNFRIKLPD